MNELLALDALRALNDAGPMGLTGYELAAKLWPGSNKRASGPAAAIAHQLISHGWAASIGHGKRRRFGITAEGREHLTTWSIEGAAANQAETEALIENYQPRFAPPVSPMFPPAVEAAIAANMRPCPPEWPCWSESQRRTHVRELTQLIIDSCVIDGRFDPALRDRALNEVIRRTKAQMARSA